MTEGLFATDTLSFAGSAGNVPNFAFGCGLANEGNFGAADGIVGLGQGPVSLLLGNANAAGVAYTPMISNPVNPTFYYAGVTGVSVNGVPVNYPANSFNILANGNGGLIIDSGTTITYLVQAAYTPILQVHIFMWGIKSSCTSSHTARSFDHTRSPSFFLPNLESHVCV